MPGPLVLAPDPRAWHSHSLAKSRTQYRGAWHTMAYDYHPSLLPIVSNSTYIRDSPPRRQISCPRKATSHSLHSQPMPYFLQPMYSRPPCAICLHSIILSPRFSLLLTKLCNSDALSHQTNILIHMNYQLYHSL